MARRYCGARTARKFAVVKPPVRSEPGTNSTTLSENRAPSPAANSAMAARLGASSSEPRTLARDDRGVEPLLPLGQQRRARLVVDEVAALLPLGGAREDARLPPERRRHGGLHVGRPRLERRDELLLDLLAQQEVDELVGGRGLLAARHHGRDVDAEDPRLVLR